jgi:hypothetical protein
MNFDEIQVDIETRLKANPALVPFLMLLENDPRATADELAAFEQRFEQAMAQLGLAIIILSPSAQQVDAVKDAGTSLLITPPIAVCENLEVTRNVQGPSRTNGLRIVQQVVRSLLSAYKFPNEPFGQPEIGKDGLTYYYIHPARRHGETAL